MFVSRAIQVAVAGTAVVLLGWLADVVAGLEFSESTVGAGRAIIVVGAALGTGAVYQGWSVRTKHTPRGHGAVVAALIGGALVASSAFTRADGHILGNALTATIGLVGLVLSLYLAQPAQTAPVETKGTRP